MIAANVAAASELAEAREPCLYRVHDKPGPDPARGAGPVPRASGRALEPDRQAARRLHPAAAGARRARHARDGLELRPAQPGAGDLQPAEHRPFRPQPEALRPLHLADPPLQRPRRPPRADPPAWAWARTGWPPSVGERAAGEPGRAPLAHRAQGHGGRAPRLRAADGAVPGRPRRHRVPGPGDHGASISACS